MIWKRWKITHQIIPRERNPVPIVQEAAWVPGPVWTGAENMAPTGIRSADHPAHNETLYRLSCNIQRSATWTRGLTCNVKLRDKSHTHTHEADKLNPPPPLDFLSYAWQAKNNHTFASRHSTRKNRRKNYYKSWFWKSWREGKFRHRLDNNIEVNLKELARSC
jgi:hypothetical protein